MRKQIRCLSLILIIGAVFSVTNSALAISAETQSEKPEVENSKFYAFDLNSLLPPDTISSRAVAVNNNNEVVVVWEDSETTHYSIWYGGDSFQEIPLQNHCNDTVYITGYTDDGLLLGDCGINGDTMWSFVYINKYQEFTRLKGFHDINDRAIARDINERGEVVGSVVSSGGKRIEARWEFPYSLKAIPIFGADSVVGINDSGDYLFVKGTCTYIQSSYYIHAYEVICYDTHPYINYFYPLAINNTGDVFGEGAYQGLMYPIVFKNGYFPMLFGKNLSRSTYYNIDLNNNGDVIFRVTGAIDPQDNGFYFGRDGHQDKIEDVTYPSGSDIRYAYESNDLGVVVGVAGNFSSPYGAVVLYPVSPISPD